MAVSVIVENMPPSAVRVGVSPLAELTARLHASTERDHHRQVQPVDEPAPGADLVEQMHCWAPLWAAYQARFLLPGAPLPQEPALGRPLAQELAAVAGLPLPVFVEHAAYAIRSGNSGPPLDRLLDDPDQQRHLRRAARLRSTARSDLADRLLDAPATFRTDLLDFLARYAETCFDPDWRHLQPRLQAQVHRLRIRIRDRDAATALAELSPSATALDMPRRVLFDKLHTGVVRLDRRPCLVVPSHYCWPHLLVKHEPGWPVIIQYGVQATHGATEPSLALLRARLQALADPARIRLCRLIAREALTTLDLAQRSGMTEPQVSRHLRQLRDAALVRPERDGRLVHYHLDLESIRNLGQDLEHAIFR
jgi:DNA-binding transcriptional ArsR family regulator